MPKSRKLWSDLDVESDTPSDSEPNVGSARPASRRDRLQQLEERDRRLQEEDLDTDGSKRPTILRTVQKLMATGDVSSEDDSCCGTVGCGTVARRSKSGQISRTVQKLMLASDDETSEDGVTRSRRSMMSEDEMSESSRGMNSGSCTPSSTAASSRTSKLHLRNMPLTRECLKKLQRRQSDKEDAGSEDMDAASSVWDDTSSMVSNSVGGSEVSYEPYGRANVNREILSREILSREILSVDLNMVQLDLASNAPFDLASNASDQPENGRVGPPVSEWSVGSVGHDTGVCKPCMFQFSRSGCSTGADCKFCHFSHCRAKFPRPSKGKRDRIKKLLSSKGDTEVSQEALEVLSHFSPASSIISAH